MKSKESRFRIHRLKRILRIAAVCCIGMMLVCVDYESALNQPDFRDAYEEGSPDNLLRQLAEQIDPKKPYSLRELVEGLLNVTPIGTPDTDSDQLPDPVEAIIGTDYTKTDTDEDQLDDYFEVFHDSDPLEPDTNFDGFPDKNEFNTTSYDLDGDGVANVWDKDNDGDSVSDALDLSPFGYSVSCETFQLDIDTDGGPLYIDFQFRPTKKEHLQLLTQTWDWPFDQEGIMRDFDNSAEDLTTQPILMVMSNVLPNQSEVDDYGITVGPDCLYVPVMPVWDRDEIVALKSKIFFPESSPTNLNLYMTLQWRVLGETDNEILSLSTLAGEYVTLDAEGNFITEASNTSTLDISLVEVGPKQVALRLKTGQYMTVDDSSKLVAGGYAIDTREAFTLERMGSDRFALKAYTGEYVTVLDDKKLGLQVDALSEDESAFSVSGFSSDNIFVLSAEDYESETVLLITYNDRMFCTGLVVEEFSESQVGFFYSANRNQTVATNLLLGAIFLRNNTNTLSTVDNLLPPYSIVVSAPSWTYGHRDEALIDMSNTLLPAILDGLPANQNLPVILATEEKSRVIEMSELYSGMYVLPSALSIDLASEPLATVKSMKTNFYNTSNYVALSLEDIMLDLSKWNLDTNASIATISMVMIWNSGQQTVSGEGKWNVEFSPPNAVLTTLVPTLAAGAVTLGVIVSTRSQNLFSTTFRALSVSISKVAKFFQLVKQGMGMTEAMNTVKCMQSIYKAGDSTASFWAKFDIGLAILGILLDVGFGIYAGIAMANEIGGKIGVEIGAVYGSIAAFFGLAIGITIFLVGIYVNPLLGAILGIIYGLGAIFGNWIGELARVITEAFVGPPHTSCETTPYFDISSTDVEIIDADGLGFNVGDTIAFSAQIVAGLNATGEDWRYIDRSYNKAWLTTILPEGSSSTNTSSITQTYPIPAGGLPNIYTSYTTNSDPAGWYYVENDCSSTVTVSPGTAMVNFPMNVRFNHYTKLTSRWYHRPFWLFGERCYHLETQELSNTSEFTTLYFDVFPSTIDGFIHWSAIKKLDYDGDGLIGDDDDKPWVFDSDSDGLSDVYEDKHGMDPELFDSDGDGLSDEWELYYGTNATNADSDGDGLRDYRELAGWEVPFEYNNTPFIIHVFSDPRSANSDGDDINDYWEYWSNTNPRSNDTNGDGIADIQRKMPQTELYTETDWSYSFGGTDVSMDEIAVDAEENVYALAHRDTSLGQTAKWFVTKMNSTLDYVPTGPGFEDVDTQLGGYLPGEHAITAYSLSSQHHNESIVVSVTDVWHAPYGRYNNYYALNGTLVDYAIVGVGDEEVERMCISSDEETAFMMSYYCEGGFYVSQWNCIEGAWVLVDVWSEDEDFNPMIGWSDVPTDIAYNEKFGLIYVSFPDKILCFDPLAVEYAFLFGTDHDTACAVEVDKSGFVYVLDAGVNNKSITVYDYNGEKYPYWCDNGRCNLQPMNPLTIDPRDLAISEDGTIYIGQMSALWSNVRRFEQNQTAISDILPEDEDSDFDQLTNLEEKTGWEISITFSNGTKFFNVTSNPLLNDTDKDLVNDYDEWVLGTNPNMPDSDGDGLRDDVEIALGTDPTHFDSDSDTLPDGLERTYGSNPNSGDSDGEGVPDAIEFSLGSNANSSDSDGDGMNDHDEYDFNSSLLLPDADNDFMFDGMENNTGTDPNFSDDDMDGIKDGFEILYHTDPMSNDSDSDGLLDGIEIDLWLDPLSDDTDGDGLSDLEELEMSTNPWCSDSDFDGIPDGQDEDSFMTISLDVTLVVTEDADDATLEFIERLREYCQLTVVSYDDFMSDYTDSAYVVLVGKPQETTDGVCSLVYELLEGTGEVLTAMEIPNAHELAVRYGIWEDTQTIVMLSRAIAFDVYTVLSILRGSNVTVFTDGIEIDYNIAHSEHYQLGVTTLSLGSIDIVKHLDATLSITLSSQLAPTVTLRKYNMTTTPYALTTFSGLLEGEEALGRYLEVSVMASGVTVTTVQESLIIMYYRHRDLDRNGNGLLNDSEDIDEATLVMYLYDDSINMWVRITDDLYWVIETGVNGTDIEVYGEVYAGYVWARVTHLSLFSIAGQQYALSFPWVSIIIWSIVIGIGIVGIAVYQRRRKGKTYTDIVHELSE
ncbi:MAG: hypothetical protein ACFFED_03965 [Candidatus Thorarchaeota archaeon]